MQRASILLGVVTVLSGFSASAQETLSPDTATSAPAPAQITNAAPLVLQLDQSEQQLQAAIGSLLEQGAGSAQLNLWMQQNVSLLQSQQSLALQLGAISAAQPLPYVTDLTLPVNASSDLDAFLSTQADLYNQYVELHNQQIATGSSASVDASFAQQNRAEIEQQAQRAQVVALQGMSQPLPVPPPLSLAPGMSVQLRALLTLHDQIERDHIMLWNQLTAATPAQRDAALELWQQQNAARFLQLQTLAQTLSQSSTN